MVARLATEADIPKILDLHFRYHVDSIEKQDKPDGFVTTAFTAEQLKCLIASEEGLSVFESNGAILAYVMAGSWKFWSRWPLFAHMIKGLPDLNYMGFTLDMKNSYQYGPVCVDKSLRGTGVFQTIFKFSLDIMSHKYPILVTFINKNNTRSYAAHTKYAGLEVIQEFSFNNNEYFQLIRSTR